MIIDKPNVSEKPDLANLLILLQIWAPAAKCINIFFKSQLLEILWFYLHLGKMFDINLKLWKSIICNVHNRTALYIVWISFVSASFGDPCIDCRLTNVGVLLCKTSSVVNETIATASLSGNSSGSVVIPESLCTSRSWMKQWTARMFHQFWIVQSKECTNYNFLWHGLLRYHVFTPRQQFSRFLEM